MHLLGEQQAKGSIMNWEHVPFPVLSDAQFLMWQALLEERTGMYIPIERKSLLQSNLAIRMREVECLDYDQYLAKVMAKPAGIVEWTTLVDRLMVQETRFFRNPESLELFASYLERCLQEGPDQRAKNIWSVGCCTGEEPYTLAIIAQEVCNDLGLPSLFGVTATDISLPALHKAREGIYSARKLLDLKQDWILRYFEPLAQDNKHRPQDYRVRNALKQRVCFSMANMIEIENSPLRNMDVIYCQNVLIYFRKERKHEILDCLVERLAPGGLLVIGQGEATHWRHPMVERMPDNRTLAFLRRTETKH